MKLLIFAHVPPPHHGQSYMVQLMLNGFGGDRRKGKSRTGGELPNHFGIECYHVNARVSKQLEDIGDFRPGKLLLLLGYCVEAIYVRFRYGVTNFYYVPAPGKSVALYRDWLVMFLCRPFFKRTILHWHASGLAKWLETVVSIRSRTITFKAARNSDLSIVLSNYGRADAEKLFPKRVAVVGNGIPDPCPSFATDVLPRRQARVAVRRLLEKGEAVPPTLRAAAGAEPHVFKLLFMAHCTRDKGLFEAVQGAILASKRLEAARSPVSVRLQVAGQFMQCDEEAEFKDLCRGTGGEVIEHVGFVSGDRKRQLLEEADLFCFPSHLESFGLVLAEAMAFGLPIVTTRCGALPEVMTSDYPGLVNVRAPEQIASAVLRMMPEAPFESLRERFITHFQVERHLANLAEAIHSVETAEPTPALQPAVQNS
jgi:glycosyltransferase involved in cell wall biosynthesis